MPWSLQQEIGCIIGTHYPEPIVDHMQAVRHARARFSELRKHHPDFQAQAKALNKKHGSRRKQPERKQLPPATNTQQMELF